jgi:cytochrome c2
MKGIKNLCSNVLALILTGVLVGCNFTGAKTEETAKAGGGNTYLGGELPLQHGMELFNQHCASCHSFMAQEIGPNLSGITSEVDKQWLAAFIKDSKAVITSGDDRAVAQYEKYKLYMPSFPMLNEKDLEDLMAFIHKFSEAEKKNRSSRQGGLLDPITEKIPMSNLTLVIEEWLTVPPNSTSGPLARINKMSALKTRGGERLFMADLHGELYEIINDTVRQYLDLKTAAENFINKPGKGTGFGSFDFHPDFEANGLFYTTHTEPPKTAPADFAIPDSIKVTLQWVLTEWKAKNPAAETFSGEKRELLRVDMITGAHGFQEVTFNPFAEKNSAEYGLLYLAVGDGASALAGYPYLCDNAGQIWGSILRIDPAGRTSKNGQYGIPEDNPFVKEKDKLDEIWSIGFRNPHRITWNPNNPSQMLVSNIGQHSLEEVDLVKKGADYGWPNREGTFLYDVNANTEVVYPLPDDDSGYSYPVIQYDHDEGNAVSGGFVYTGDNIPLLKNKYIFGDIARGTLLFAETAEIIEGQQAPLYKLGLMLNGESTSLTEISKVERVELRLGIDSIGELYIFTKCNGKVYRVIGCKEEQSI